jgi:hypothetical protein
MVLDDMEEICGGHLAYGRVEEPSPNVAAGMAMADLKEVEIADSALSPPYLDIWSMWMSRTSEGEKSLWMGYSARRFSAFE